MTYYRYVGILFRMKWNNVPVDMEQCSGLYGIGVHLTKNTATKLIMCCKQWCYAVGWFVNLEAWK